MSGNVALLEHFRRLADFRGREDRASFWPYAALVFGIVMVAGMIIFVPVMRHAMDAMQQYAATHPDQVSEISGPGQYSISVNGNSPGIMPAGPILLYLLVTFGLSLTLYAAAVVRRLHDRGRSGWWGLMPLPFIVYSTIEMPLMMSSGGDPDLGLFFSIFISNMLYLVALITLIVLLAGPSRPEANPFDVQ